MQYSDPLMAGGSLAMVDRSQGTLTDLYVGYKDRVFLQVAGAVLGSFDGRGKPSSGGPL